MSIVGRIDALVESGLTEGEAINVVAKEDGKEPEFIWALNYTFRKYDQVFKNLKDR